MKHIKTPLEVRPWAKGQADILDADGNVTLLADSDRTAAEVVQAVNVYDERRKALGSALWVLTNRHNRHSPKWAEFAAVAEAEIRAALEAVDG